MLRSPTERALAPFGSIRPGSRLPAIGLRSWKTMLGFARFLSGSFFKLSKESGKLFSSTGFTQHQLNSLYTEDPKLQNFLDYMEQLKNYERLGVPKGAGTDSDDGFDLGRMRRLLQLLGDPHSRFKAVHVAGTKGKGSTAAFLSNILQEEGYFVGCYTSPHLLTIRERISFNGGPVSVETLINLFSDVRGILDLSIEQEGGALTHFEVLTALSFTLFSQEGIDIAVIEAGLGGARDATNVLCSTGLAASIITSIGEEHLSALGGSLESIALAKSGIIKHGRPVVIGSPLQPHIEHIIRNKAASLSSPFLSAWDAGAKSHARFFGRAEVPYQCCEIHIEHKKDTTLFLDFPEVKLQMIGNHQLQNAVTATCTALCLQNQGWRISNQSIQAGLEKTRLPGRGQYLTKKETETFGLPGVSILLDGAHTEASAKGLTDIIKMEDPYGVLALVVSMASDKDHMSFAVQLLTGLVPEVVILTETSIAGSRSRSTSAFTLKDTWFRAATNLGISALDFGTFDHGKAAEFPAVCPGKMKDKQVWLMACPNAAVGDSMQIADQLLRSRAGEKPHLVVVTGSLHIVSSVLACINSCCCIS